MILETRMLKKEFFKKSKNQFGQFGLLKALALGFALCPPFPPTYIP
jgi:hypothetical protein